MAKHAPRATVLIPTHDHAELLDLALGSAIRQTIREIEIVVVGDGVGDDTRRVIDHHARADSRIRFFDHSKGERHGETYRHLALREALGAIVCYLCDDDLWLADHVEKMLSTLESSDFAHSVPVRIQPGGDIETLHVDLGMNDFQQLLRTRENRIPLTVMAHTLAAYRRLPFGWRVTPPGTPTDLHMIRQFLDCPGLRFAACHLPTALNFPSPWRTEWSPTQRHTELASWAKRIDEPGFRAWLIESVCAQKISESCRLESEQRAMHVLAQRHQNDLARQCALNMRLAGELDAIRAELGTALSQLAVTRRRPEQWALRQVGMLRRFRRLFLSG